MNPVLEFLQTHDTYSFDEGVDILLRYSANVGVNTFIVRRRDKGHLHAELVRLAHMPRLKDLRPTTPKQPEKSEESQPVEAEASDADDDTVDFLSLERHKQYDPDKLPPMLKELWLKNRDEYKELQYCHQQMEQANSDAGRADWRKQIIEHQQSLQKRWQLFDDEIAKTKEENSENGFNAFNARAYISRMLKKNELTDANRVEVQKRIDQLLMAGVAMKDDTKEKLIEKGFSVSMNP